MNISANRQTIRGGVTRLWWLLTLSALMAILSPTARLHAAGEEYTRRGDDLVLTVSTRWAGATDGGYYPIRILVQNKGVDCTLSFRFSGQQPGIATTERTIAVAQNASVKFTLPVPVVGTGTYGELKVYRNGRLVKGLNESLAMPDMNYSGSSRPSFLVISPTNVDFDAFETAVTSTTSAGSSGYGRGGYYGGIAPENHERIEPTLLPEEWIAYSGLDLVAVPLQTLGKFSTAERAALVKWVETGGSLVVTSVGEEAARSQQLNDLLNINQHAAVSPEWLPAEVSKRKRIRIVEMDDYGNILTPEESTEKQTAETAGDFVWDESGSTFASRDLMLGHVYAFRENPFPGSPHDWNWFLSSIPADAKSWISRHGITPRIGSDEFLQFLIPSVRGVPVLAFLTLITLFTVVIGPLNYMFLWKRRRLYLLVLTIPIIALATSFALFGYSAVAHGFSTKSRARTLTFVDQDAKSAITMSRVALYAGLAPSDGLRFSADTAVMPIWPENHEFDSATTDWTEQQNLRSGWLNSRTRTQFVTLGHRDERGRLEVSDGGDTLTVTNGFEWGMEALVVSDDAGKFYYGANIPAGGSAELSPMTTEQRSEFANLLKQHPLHPPDVGPSSGGWFDWNINSYYGYEAGSMANFSSGKLEQLMSQAKNLQYSGANFPPSAYVALLNENPGVEIGMESTRPQASLHVLIGRY